MVSPGFSRRLFVVSPSTVCGFLFDCLWFLSRLFVVSPSTVCGFSFDCLWFLLRLFVDSPSTVYGFFFTNATYKQGRVFIVLCAVFELSLPFIVIPYIAGFTISNYDLYYFLTEHTY